MHANRCRQSFVLLKAENHITITALTAGDRHPGGNMAAIIEITRYSSLPLSHVFICFILGVYPIDDDFIPRDILLLLYVLFSV